MKNIVTKEIINTLIGLILVLIGAALVAILGFNGVKVFMDLSDTVQVGLVVALLSLVGTLYSLRSTRLKEVHVKIDEQQRKQKRIIYDNFVKDFLNGIAEDDENIKADLFLNAMRKFMQSGLLWAGEDVLKAFHKFRIDAQKDTNEMLLLFDFADIILAFRKELGYSNKDIDSKMVLDVFLNGVDDAIMEALSEMSIENAIEGSDANRK